MTYGIVSDRYASAWESDPVENMRGPFAADATANLDTEDVLLRATRVLAVLQQRRHRLRQDTQRRLGLSA
jgi:hypothetical protein